MHHVDRSKTLGNADTLLTAYDLWLLSEGSHQRPYACMGAHPQLLAGVEGTRFAVWAPNAQSVWVLGDFNAWEPSKSQMMKDEGSGIWQCFVEGAKRGDCYQYRIIQSGGQDILKSDPYAFRTEMRPGKASVIEGLQRSEPAITEHRPSAVDKAAMSIYEVHLGSWRKRDGWRWMSYDELAAELIDYVVDMGFTHLELMPIMEHPYDPSWGYQPLGLYAPTARYGTPAQFARFVETAHQRGLGVILDWTPSHFPNDPHGLVQFDGTALYEHLDPREGYHPDWHTMIFNLGRREVANYLLGNALFWIEQYGIDGLRVDAVASMLYRDYSRSPGQWIPNQWGGRENLESISFLKQLNGRFKSLVPHAITIAEESTAFPKVTHRGINPVEADSLGFDHKWNMGWMHDTLRYFSTDPIYRRYRHHDLTFGMMYAFTEHFVLPLSHDEVVHGKGSLLRKMPGDRWQAFANLRCLLAYMWSYPGKKLLFMGSEWGSPKEWSQDEALPWHLLEERDHAGVQSLLRRLNAIYRTYAALSQTDHRGDGFQWVHHDDHSQSVIAYLRRLGPLASRAGGEESHSEDLLMLCNLTPMPRPAYRTGVPCGGDWRVLLNTDSEEFAGSAFPITDAIQVTANIAAEPIGWHGFEQSIKLNIPPLSVLYLRAPEKAVCIGDDATRCPS